MDSLSGLPAVHKIIITFYGLLSIERTLHQKPLKTHGETRTDANDISLTYLLSQKQNSQVGYTCLSHREEQSIIVPALLL